MRGVVNFGCVPISPAHVRIAFHHRPHYLQELDPRSREAAVGICEVFTGCGLDTEHTDQISNMVWRKAVLNACMNPICAVTGKTMVEIIIDPILFQLVDALIKEGVAVARANEFALGSDFYPYCINYIKNAGNHKPSMLQDIEAGRRTEIDYINGKIVEYGAQAGMATPYNTMIRGLVKALEPKDREPQWISGPRLRSLAARMHDLPAVPDPGRGALRRPGAPGACSRATFRRSVLRTFLSSRGGNMYLLYNLLLDGREPLDPQIPLIFGSGVLTGTRPHRRPRQRHQRRLPTATPFSTATAATPFPPFSSCTATIISSSTARPPRGRSCELSGEEVTLP